MKNPFRFTPNERGYYQTFHMIPARYVIRIIICSILALVGSVTAIAALTIFICELFW